MTRSTRRTRARLALGAALALSALTLGASLRTEATEAMRLSDLREHTHVHGLAVDRNDPSRLLVATHHGLFSASPEGEALRISIVQDFMGFNPHPSDPDVLYASGHPVGGGNLGFIASTDAGATWTQISPGAEGPVDFTS